MSLLNNSPQDINKFRDTTMRHQSSPQAMIIRKKCECCKRAKPCAGSKFIDGKRHCADCVEALEDCEE